jgi:hypothetical protein
MRDQIFSVMPAAPAGNDRTAREAIWHRFSGDDWAAFDALPPAVRRRMQEHAYDAWSVNALMLWRSFRRKLACSERAERRLLRYLDQCEALECAAFADAYHRRYAQPLPHVAAGGSVLRYACNRGSCPPGTGGRGVGESWSAGQRDDGLHEGERHGQHGVRVNVTQGTRPRVVRAMASPIMPEWQEASFRPAARHPEPSP